MCDETKMAARATGYLLPVRFFDPVLLHLFQII